MRGDRAKAIAIKRRLSTSDGDYGDFCDVYGARFESQGLSD